MTVVTEDRKDKPRKISLATATGMLGLPTVPYAWSSNSTAGCAVSNGGLAAGWLRVNRGVFVTTIVTSQIAEDDLLRDQVLLCRD